MVKYSSRQAGMVLEQQLRVLTGMRQSLTGNGVCF